MGKGMELAKGYYLEFGRPMLEENSRPMSRGLPAVLSGKAPMPLVFDDQLSRDHDFGPGFCLWLADEDMERIGPALQEAYLALPQTFQGFERKRDEGMASGRTGVMRISDFMPNLPAWRRGRSSRISGCGFQSSFWRPPQMARSLPILWGIHENQRESCWNFIQRT